MTYPGGITQSYSMLQNLAAVANSKLQMQQTGSNYPYSFPQLPNNPTASISSSFGFASGSTSTSGSHYLGEQGNIRSDIAAVVNPMVQSYGQSGSAGGIIPNWVYNSISQGSATNIKGWPVSSPDVTRAFMNFFYLYNGPQYVSFTSSPLSKEPAGSAGNFTVSNYYSYVFPYRFGEGVTPGGNCGTDLEYITTQSMITSQDYSITVGGDGPVPLACDFVIGIALQPGGTYSSVATINPPFNSIASVGGFSITSGSVPLPSLDTGDWIPGFSWTMLVPPSWEAYISQSNGTGNLWLVSHVSGNIPPGTYTLTVNVSLPVDSFVGPTVSPGPGCGNYSYSSVTTGNSCIIPWNSLQGGPNNQSYLQIYRYNSYTGSWLLPTTQPGPIPSITLTTLGPGIPYAGISNSLPVYKIDCSSIYNIDTFFPTGLFWNVLPEVDNGAWRNPQAPPLQPVFTTMSYWPAQNWSIQTTIGGLWTGCTGPEVPFVLTNQTSEDTIFSCAWNTAVKGINPYQSGSTLASALENSTLPSQWAANQNITRSFQLQDSNGNMQQANVGGQTGATNPTWAQTIGHSTTDGTVRWNCIWIPSSPSSSISPFQARAYCVQGYPYQSISEPSNSYYQVPTSSAFGQTAFGYGSQYYDPTSGWVINDTAGGWFLYQFTFFRYGSVNVGGSPSVYLASPGEIPVTIGCMRSGSFINFNNLLSSSFQTGQTYTILIPIFTSTPLIYQTANNERIGIVAIPLPGENSSLEFIPNPVFATHFNDELALLALTT